MKTLTSTRLCSITSNSVPKRKSTVQSDASDDDDSDNERPAPKKAASIKKPALADDDSDNDDTSHDEGMKPAAKKAAPAPAPARKPTPTMKPAANDSDDDSSSEEEVKPTPKKATPTKKPAVDNFDVCCDFCGKAGHGSSSCSKLRRWQKGRLEEQETQPTAVLENGLSKKIEIVSNRQKAVGNGLSKISANSKSIKASELYSNRARAIVQAKEARLIFIIMQ